jgi:alkylated DNA repair dioxygenase AlkB
MAQPDLLGSDHGLLLDDASGRIRYLRGAVAAGRAEAWFAQLRKGIAWHTERREMYGREVDVPRLTANFRLGDPALPPALREAADTVLGLTDIAFNSAGLNLYRDGNDSVAPHNDHLHELQRGYPIALLSLGATRRMTIRAKHPPRRMLNVDLEPGSLLLMSWRTQHHYDHGIPKTRAAVGPRISVAFRRRPQGTSRAGFYHTADA